MAVTSVNIDDEVLERMKELSRRRDRSVSYLVTEACKDLLEKTATTKEIRHEA